MGIKQLKTRIQVHKNVFDMLLIIAFQWAESCHELYSLKMFVVDQECLWVELLRRVNPLEIKYNWKCISCHAFLYRSNHQAQLWTAAKLALLLLDRGGVECSSTRTKMMLDGSI